MENVEIEQTNEAEKSIRFASRQANAAQKSNARQMGEGVRKRRKVINAPIS